MATTALATSFKAEMLSGIHCMNATVGPLTCTCNTTTAMTGLSSTAGISVGMSVTGTNVAANTYVANIVSNTALTLSVASTGALTSATFTGDPLYMCLIKVSPSLTYAGTQTNYGSGSGTPTTSNIGTDEMTNTSGVGYTAGGQLLVNVTPTTSGTTAYTSFSNPSWTSATFSCTAGIIYNNATRGGAAATPIGGRTISVHDFGGTQTVSSGTFTIVMPTANSSTAILRFN
jgi:hypothetical protein